MGKLLFVSCLSTIHNLVVVVMIPAHPVAFTSTLNPQILHYF